MKNKIVGKHQGKEPLGRIKRRRKNTKMDLR
jgi:hypothetical protein